VNTIVDLFRHLEQEAESLAERTDRRSRRRRLSGHIAGLFDEVRSAIAATAGPASVQMQYFRRLLSSDSLESNPCGVIRAVGGLLAAAAQLSYSPTRDMRSSDAALDLQTSALRSCDILGAAGQTRPALLLAGVVLEDYLRRAGDVASIDSALPLDTLNFNLMRAEVHSEQEYLSISRWLETCSGAGQAGAGESGTEEVADVVDGLSMLVAQRAQSRNDIHHPRYPPMC
jgi:hypothetical protein